MVFLISHCVMIRYYSVLHFKSGDDKIFAGNMKDYFLGRSSFTVRKSIRQKYLDRITESMRICEKAAHRHRHADIVFQVDAVIEKECIMTFIDQNICGRERFISFSLFIY